MLQGVIFDWDGVIIDSHAAHKASWEKLAAELGQPIPEDHMERGFGRKNEVIIPEILGWATDPEEVTRLGNWKEELYREELKRSGITPLPGVKPFLEMLRDAGIPCAVGSSTQRKNIEVAIMAMGLSAYFEAIACAEDVTRSKPAPDVFLKAAEKLGLAPSGCVVFEDAPFGLEAAKAGGMVAIGVTTSHPAAALLLADRHVARLDELSLNDLHDLVGRNAPHSNSC